MSPISSDEKYQEWLDRLEIPIEETIDIESFQGYLKDEFGIIKEAQVQALWGATEMKDVLAEHGIRSVTIQYPWGKELRFGVQGLVGLWGWKSVEQILAEEE